MKFERALFIFRRDLRLEDNTGLIFALKNAKSVIPAFIFTPDQIEHNAYASVRCLQFMIESLEDLAGALSKKGAHLSLFYGNPAGVVAQCIEKLQVDAVIVNKDYTPYSLQRDHSIASICMKQGASFHAFDDCLLNPPQETLKADGKPYTIFTPFYRNASKCEPEHPAENHYSNYCKKSIPFADESIISRILPTRFVQAKGGRTAALELMENDFRNYENLRDFPALRATTHLSAHLKFTTCSAREIYYALAKRYGTDHELIRSLYWRDFFTSIAFFFPHVFKGPFHQRFEKLAWKNDEESFKRWCEGKTGFPIVDAGMREMNQTGFMHNRVRMIAAAFLVKDLHIDWRWGEKYFAQKLIDYDPAINNGNWQWSASTGCDSQPYFRIFNPWTQGLKFDADCEYIKKWIPELTPLAPAVIHKRFLPKNQAIACNYPLPIVDHATETKVTLDVYRKIKPSF